MSIARHPMVMFAPKPSSAYLLDTYTGANAAFAFWQLRTGQTLMCRVRRSSDDAETDILFNATYPELNLNSPVSAGGTLTAWIGANDGYLVTMYDQSGSGNNHSQSVTANQKLLINSGALNTALLSSPYAQDGHLLELSSIYFSSPEATVLSVAASSNTVGCVYFDASRGATFSVDGSMRLDNSTTARFGTYNGTTGDFITTTQTPINTPELRVAIVSNSGRTMRKNGSVIASDSKTGGVNWSRANYIDIWGYRHLTPIGVYGWLHISYPTDKTAQIAAIETFINTHYGIY